MGQTTPPKAQAAPLQAEFPHSLPKFCDSGLGSLDHKGEGCRKNLSLNKNILRIVRTDVVVDGLRQEQYLGAVVTENVRHGADYPTQGPSRTSSGRVSTQSA